MAAPQWHREQFTVSTFCVVRPGDDFERILPHVAELGLNCLELNTPLEYTARDLAPDEVHRVLNLCEQLGMRLIVTDHERLTGVEDPTDAQLQWLVDEYGASPALGGFYAWDEPHTEHFPALARTYERLRQLDPTRLTVTALLPGLAKYKWPEDYPDYVRGFAEIVKPDVLSFDHYGVHRHGITPVLFDDLSLWGELSAEHDIPLWFYPACCQWATIAKPSAATLRFQGWNALAHGAKGLQWFVVRDFTGGDVDFVGAPLKASGEPGSMFNTFRDVGAEIRKAGELLLDAKLQSVRRDPDGSLLCSHLSARGTEYAIVLNCDLDKPLAARTVEAAGADLDIEELGPGCGALYKASGERDA